MIVIIKNMETSLKTGFAQIFSCCPKNLSCPNFGGAAAPLAPPGPYAYVQARVNFDQHKNISPVKHLIIKTFSHFIKTYPDFPDFFRVWKIAGQILRLSQELKTLYEPC